MTEGETPSAALTVSKLIAAGLLREEKREALAAKIANGSMKGEDWRLEIDLANLKGEQA